MWITNNKPQRHPPLHHWMNGERWCCYRVKELVRKIGFSFKLQIPFYWYAALQSIFDCFIGTNRRGENWRVIDGVRGCIEGFLIPWSHKTHISYAPIWSNSDEISVSSCFFFIFLRWPGWCEKDELGLSLNTHPLHNYYHHRRRINHISMHGLVILEKRIEGGDSGDWWWLRVGLWWSCSV